MHTRLATQSLFASKIMNFITLRLYIHTMNSKYFRRHCIRMLFYAAVPGSQLLQMTSACPNRCCSTFLFTVQNGSYVAILMGILPERTIPKK